MLFLIVVSVFGAYFLLTTRPDEPAEEMCALPPSASFPSAGQIEIPGQMDCGWTLRRLGGEPTTLSAFKNRVVFIHCWATWCRPWCVAELPGIHNLCDSLRNEGLVFILVSEDKDEKVLRRFLKERQFNCPVHLREEATPTVFQAMGVPATFIVGHDG